MRVNMLICSAINFTLHGKVVNIFSFSYPFDITLFLTFLAFLHVSGLVFIFVKVSVFVSKFKKL